MCELGKVLVPLLDARVNVVAHNHSNFAACADLYLMTQCHHFTIANSSFNSWGMSKQSKKES